MKRKIVALSVVLTMILTSAAGCAGESNAPGAGETPSTGKDTLAIAITYDVTTFTRLSDMSGSDLRVFNNMFDPLIFSRKGEVTPCLAESWMVSDDGLTYTFNLRKNVKFTNGEELKASDVVFTFEQSMASAYTASSFSSVEDVIALDDYSVEVTLLSPNATFFLSVSQMPIISEKVWVDAGGTAEGYNQNPVGTGPYILSEHNIGQNIVLERNENYWGEKPAIKTVNFQIISDPNTAAVALQSGDIDVFYYPTETSIAELRQQPNLKANHFIENELKCVFVNCSAEPFDDVRVRQALSYAIDKESMILIAANGNAIQSDILATPDVFGYSDNIEGYEYNVEKAKELLSEAGYANDLEVNIIALPGVYTTIAEVLQQQYALVGVTATVQTLDKNAYVEALISGNYQLGTFGSDLEPDLNFWSQIFEEGAGRNMVFYNNTDVSNMLKKGRETIDTNKRLQIYEQLLQRLRDDVPIIPLYCANGQIFTNKDLTIGYIDTQSIFLAAEAHWN